MSLFENTFLGFDKSDGSHEIYQIYVIGFCYTEFPKDKLIDHKLNASWEIVTYFNDDEKVEIRKVLLFI